MAAAIAGDAMFRFHKPTAGRPHDGAKFKTVGSNNADIAGLRVVCFDGVHTRSVCFGVEY